MNSGAISFVIYVSICFRARAFLGQWGQTHSVSLPCSVLYLMLHFPDSCVPCLASGLSQWEALAGKSGGRGQCVYLSVTQMMLPLHLQLPPHRSTLVLASTQILQLTPGLLIASLFYLYRLGWEWAPEAAGHWCLTVCGFTSQFFQPTRHQCGRSARPLSMHSCAPLPSNPVTRQGYRQTISGPAKPLAGAPVGPSPKQPTVNERPLVRQSANCLWMEVLSWR